MPRRNERPITGILSKTNFLTANAVDTILAVPRRLAKPEPNYLEKEDYGKVPAYLEQASYKKGDRICVTVYLFSGCDSQTAIISGSFPSPG